MRAEGVVRGTRSPGGRRLPAGVTGLRSARVVCGPGASSADGDRPPERAAPTGSRARTSVSDGAGASGLAGVAVRWHAVHPEFDIVRDPAWLAV
ncbi:hypothetical protein, partial [Streptomyces beihaiensis]